MDRTSHNCEAYGRRSRGDLYAAPMRNRADEQPIMGDVD